MRRSEGGRRLTAQFYRGNLGCLCVAGAAALASGLLILILSWMMQELIDAAGGLAADGRPAAGGGAAGLRP